MTEDFIEKAKLWATKPVPGSPIPDEVQMSFSTMPIEELAGRWCTLQYLGIKDLTQQSQMERAYFDHLPHEQPERAFALALAVLKSEAHLSVVMHLNNRLMSALLMAHGVRLAEQIEAAARGNQRLRWLLGGSYWWVSDRPLRARLETIADEDAWRGDAEAHSTPDNPIDYAALSIHQLAQVWIDQKSKAEKDQDDNWQALFDYERELITNSPDTMVDLILEILRIESHPSLIGLLAAGPLEDVISMRVIDRIERETAGNEAFRKLLDGVWYWNEPQELKTRLNVITGRDW